MVNTETLLRRAQQGDTAALGEILAGKQGVCFGFALRLTRDPTAAQDLCQEAFLRATRDIGACREPAVFQRWLFQLVYGAYRDLVRSDHARKNRERRDGAMPEEREECGALERLAQKELVECLQQAMNELRESYRLALHLHYEQGFTFGHAAVVLGIAHGTFATNIRRGLEELRERLGAQGFACATPMVALALQQAAPVQVPAALTAFVKGLALAGAGKAARAGAATGDAVAAGAGAKAAVAAGGTTLAMKVAVAAVVVASAVGLWQTAQSPQMPAAAPAPAPVQVADAPAAAEVRAAELFVATTGDDANPGTLDKPFATLQRAQQAARKLAGREAVTVLVREGTYYLPEALVLTAEDSGTEAAPVVYRAYQKEHAVISGGLRLEGLKWQPYKDGIMQATVPAGFVTDQLFVNGRGQPMARYPNFDPNVPNFNGWAADAFSPQRAERWKSPAGGVIHALHGAGWGSLHYVITGKGPDNKVTHEGGWQNNRQWGMSSSFRFVENIFEELDAPGEWFLDSKAGTLYFYPPAGVDPVKATIEGVRLRSLVEFHGKERAPVRFVSFKGLIFSHAARTFMDTREPILRSDWTVYRGGALFLNGAEDCTIEDCVIDQVGGNAVFVNDYNRRVTVRGCHISEAGGSGVLFVGDPNACYNPLKWGQTNRLDKIDRTPGPRTNNYPADCLVDDCLIHNIGQVEKQTAGVTVDIAERITIRHCSIYDMPRAGINLGDGCWGGHVIEFCDVFDTVKETGDHGSFNSWGRDRSYRDLVGMNWNDDAAWEADKDVALLDAVKPNTIRNSRWRCDRGWDIDLDGGSTNYRIYNNLCLRGGIKNRDGFYRVVENNIMINCGYDPHCWYKHSQDIVRRNIMGSSHYRTAGNMPTPPWGKDVDYNLIYCEGVANPRPAKALADQSGRDEHSIIADAMFVDSAKGDFRVREGSPALKLGFVNFPMDQFGVQKPELKAVARTPKIPVVRKTEIRTPVTGRADDAWQARIRDISGLGDRSAYGLPDESGVLLLEVPATSTAAKAGLRKDDVILACNGQPVKSAKDLRELRGKAAGQKLTLTVWRDQEQATIEMKE